jgi:hypothetical protein
VDWLPEAALPKNSGKPQPPQAQKGPSPTTELSLLGYVSFLGILPTGHVLRMRWLVLSCPWENEIERKDEMAVSWFMMSEANI